MWRTPSRNSTPLMTSGRRFRTSNHRNFFYAKIVNADGYLPVSAISNTMRDAMLGRGLVTAERLRERGIR